MKRLTREQILALVPKMRELVDDMSIKTAGPMLELANICRWVEKDPENFDVEKVNLEILETPLSEVMAYRRYGLDLPKHNFDEKLED